MDDWSSDGIYLRRSDNNAITSNFIYENYCCGIRITESDNNTVVANTIYNNLVGIFFGKKYQLSTDPSACSNIIVVNYLVNNNKYNSYDKYDCNRWFIVSDNVTGGNRYGDFDDPTEGCRDRDKDGICDFAYEIPGYKTIDTNPLTSHLAEGTITKSWSDSIKNKDLLNFSISVPSNVTILELRLDWDDSDNDLDLLLFDQNGNLVDKSESGSSNIEVVMVFAPETAVWNATVHGYKVAEGEKQIFKLEVLQF